MFKTIGNALKTPEVRKKILYTLLLIVIFRLGCYITVPGVDTFALSEAFGEANGMASLIDLISGGAFSRFSIFAMSISPYITASIVLQLLSMVIPALERLTKEGGEEGRKKINRYTKILTVFLALIEGLALYLSYNSLGIFINNGFITGATVVISLMAGTALLMWLGDEITNKGIGNGISIIIFVGIIAGLPGAVTMIWDLIMPVAATGARTFSTTGLLLALLLTQIVAFPAALIFGKLSSSIENTKLIKICIFAYFLIALYGITLQQQYQFWILAVGVGIFQGAIQSLSRSYYAKIIPANRSGEYFGLYDICGKGASFMGTTLVSLISQVTGMMNIGVGSLAIMFFIGFVFFKKTEKLHQ